MTQMGVKAARYRGEPKTSTGIFVSLANQELDRLCVCVLIWLAACA